MNQGGGLVRPSERLLIAPIKSQSNTLTVQRILEGGTRKPIDHPFVITWKVTTLAKYTPEEDVVIIVTVAVIIKSVETYYGVRQKSFR